MYGLYCSVKVALMISDRKPKRICKGSSKNVKLKGREVQRHVFLASTLDGRESYPSAVVPPGKEQVVPMD
jgi:hypothetical protein